MSRLREAMDALMDSLVPPQLAIANMGNAITEAEETIADLKHDIARYVAANTDLLADVERLTRERDEARRGDHRENEHEPTWSEVADYWKRKAERLDEALERLIDHYGAKTFTGVLVSAGEQYPWIAQAMTARAARKEPT